jgi:N4-gp56 family major capsid protein
MADVFTDGTVYANLLTAGYDKFLEFQLRSQPIFRQFIDKHPVDVTNPGPTVTLSLIQEYASLATTPLSEDVDISAVAPPAPIRVTVTLNEYGNGEVTTLRLRDLAFAQVDPAVANILGKNMVDTMDKLVQNTYDGATHIIGVNATVVKTDASGFAEASVAAGDVMNSNVVLDAATLLRRRNVAGRDGNDQFVALIHPDVAVDIMTNTGWLQPHQYSDPSNIYRAEIGTYLGSRFITTPRATIVADGAASAKVYRTYFLGQQGVVEAVVRDAHTVIGPQTDKLRRFFPVGWYAHAGWAIYRQEAIQIARTASSVAGL